jgi:hypothetical protein
LEKGRKAFRPLLRPPAPGTAPATWRIARARVDLKDVMEERGLKIKELAF